MTNENDNVGAPFKVKKLTKTQELVVGATLPESDFAILTPEGFVQFEYLSKSSQIKKLEVKPGIFSIFVESSQLVLKEVSFSSEPLLEEYTSTKDIASKINSFFNNLHVYKNYKIFPKRGMLLYGSAGCGKSVAISKLCQQYGADGKTLVLNWPSNKIAARDVKDFIQSFDYTDKVDKLILVIEDLGGVEVKDTDMPSDSSLLALLDNIGNIFRVPTLILATTNFPENFLENLTDRPQRFDDVIEFKKPSAEFRGKFLQFFGNGSIPEESVKNIQNAKYDNFSVAHIKEVVIRSAIYSISLEEAMEQILAQSARTKRQFTNKSSRMGIGYID